MIWWVQLILTREPGNTSYLWVPWEGDTLQEARQDAVDYFQKTYPAFQFDSILSQSRVPKSVQAFIKGGEIIND